MTSPPVYRALDLLTRGGYAPKRDRREPFWRPKSPAVAKHVYTPAWSFESVSKTEPGTEIIDLDVNAAFLAALISGDYAHGALEHTGAWAQPSREYRPHPGYYLITPPPWNAHGIPSPLGTVEYGDQLWVAAPTADLLLEVAADGYTAAPEFHDSYTTPENCRLRKWGERIRDDRAEVIDSIPPEITRRDDWPPYKALKDGYSMAVQMFLGKDDQAAKSPVYRPDWYHTVHAQHAASTWRKAYRAWQAGCAPARMGSVDQVSFTITDWEDLQGMSTPPFRLDQSGKSPGSFKAKDRYVIQEAQHADA